MRPNQAAATLNPEEWRQWLLETYGVTPAEAEDSPPFIRNEFKRAFDARDNRDAA